MTMIQKLNLVKITRRCFSTYSSRLIFILINKCDFCTRNELTNWTGFSSITISRYLQEFSKAGLIVNAPGIVFPSNVGKEVFIDLNDLFQVELSVANKIMNKKEIDYY
jgi:DeoR/GlpR family transcriptional regulator of sugar metabolism